MKNLAYKASAPMEFEIQVDEYGDIVDTLEFVLEKASK
jgi:hypothetical protein